MILDVGCGSKKRGDIGIDYKKNPYGKKAELDVLAYSEFLPFRPNTFDKVVSYNIFEHLLNPFNSLKEAVRVLKPNGEVFIETDNPSLYNWSLLARGFGQISHEEYCFDHYGIFYPKNIARMLNLLDCDNFKLKWIPREYDFAKGKILKKAIEVFILMRLFRPEVLHKRYQLLAIKKFFYLQVIGGDSNGRKRD